VFILLLKLLRHVDFNCKYSLISFSSLFFGEIGPSLYKMLIAKSSNLAIYFTYKLQYYFIKITIICIIQKLGLGFYVPSNVVTNDDLSKNYYTNDEWIQERTGIQERRHIIRGEDTTTMGSKAANSAFWRCKRRY
jgi:hypothetical protein